jgi:hypothetical protein
VHATSGSCDVTGSVFYYRDSAGAGSEPSTKPVPNVGIDATQDATADATTGVSGGYAFDGLYGNVTLTTVVKYGAPRASDHNGAITGTDAAQIARRAVNLVTFSANQQVAGDVTGNGAISALDAAQVARFSVLLVDHFDVAVSTGSDWKFLRCDVYPGCGAPVYNFTPISGAESGKNFHAVLYGDVTGNWSPGSSFTSAKAGESELDDRDRLAIAVVPAVVAPEAGVVRRPAGTSAAISIDALTTPLRAGERRQLTISVGGSDGILGLDLLLTYDARTVAIVDVQAAGLASGWGVAHADEGGTHRISTYGISPLHGDGQVLTVTVEGRGSGTKTRPLVLSAVANEGSIPLVVKPRIKAVERPDVQGVER